MSFFLCVQSFALRKMKTMIADEEKLAKTDVQLCTFDIFLLC